ncbi:MAG: YkvA family protein [Halanaerobiales bacterium]
MSRKIMKLVKVLKFFKDKDVKWTKKLLFLAPVIYFLSPIDFVPDFFLIPGLLDDLAVFIVMWPILTKLLEDYQKDSNNSTGKSKKAYKDSIDISRDDYNIK